MDMKFATTKLTPQEKTLLNYLIDNRGKVLKSVPIIGMEDSRSLRVYVYRLRAKIGKHKITTVHGQGYVFVGDKL